MSGSLSQRVSQHFLSTIYSPQFLIHRSLIFHNYVCHIEYLKKWFEFGSFAYSIWLPNWLNRIPTCTFSCPQFIAWVLSFNMYLSLRYSSKICRFGSFEYSIWPAEIANLCSYNTLFYLQPTDLTAVVSIFHMYHEVFQIICKFGSFEYTKWPPK